ncbi:hypothetical protein M233_09350 [Xylella fastidiosa subsp. multiplex Griffin-1]|nr:hypothetical protein M233_09350 [Xylella fastidiosa subsp. multiplex Griffin-1]
MDDWPKRRAMIFALVMFLTKIQNGHLIVNLEYHK